MKSSEVYEYIKDNLSTPELWGKSKGNSQIFFKCSVCSLETSKTKSNICESISASLSKQLTCSLKCSNASKKISHEDFVNRANKLFNAKYLYPYSIVDTSTPLVIVCPFHGEFTILPKTHLQGGKGCLKCYKDVRVKTQSDWISDAQQVWGDLYEYSENYLSAHVKLEIKCKIHGIFLQTPANHLSGKGCRSCSFENNVSFNKASWLARSHSSPIFDSYKVYVLLVFNDEESFIKIGRTYTTVKSRYNGSKLKTYQFKIIKEFIFDNGEECWNKELELHRKYSQFSYTPSILFDGFSECFDPTVLKDFTTLDIIYD
jgi:hypothetical protein